MKNLIIPLVLILVLLPACTCHVSDGYIYSDCYGDLDPCIDSSFDVGANGLEWSTGYFDVIGATSQTNTNNLTVAGEARFADVWKLHRLPLENFRKGVAAPVDHIRSGYAGYLFTNVNEEITLEAPVPIDWDGESDIYFLIGCVIINDETANDKIDWRTSVKSATDHEDIDIIGTQTPQVDHDIGIYTEAGRFHIVSITLDYDDATCPLAPLDCLSITLHRSANVGTAGYCASIMVVNTCIYYHSDKIGPLITP